MKYEKKNKQKRKRKTYSQRMKIWKNWKIFTILLPMATHLYNLMNSFPKFLMRFEQVFVENFSILLLLHVLIPERFLVTDDLFEHSIFAIDFQ